MGHSCGVTNIADADYISSFVGERLAAKGLLRSPVPLRRYCQGGEDPDSKLVFLSEGEPGFVVTVSPPEFPEVVAEECLKAAQMRARLGDLSGPILEPLDAGRVQTSSYAVLPYRNPFSKRRGIRWMHRIWARHHVLEWLLQVTRGRSAACDASRYEAALETLGESVPRDSPTAALLRAADGHLRSGRFAPKTTPMHGDLWGGNVLRGTAATTFTLIDWRGSTTDGFPLFDLIRTAESFALSARALRLQLRRHRAALGCQVADLPLYLLGALGHYAAHLGEMSPVLFRTMADGCATRFLCACEAPA
jgi:Phosphotransferase enzyme family